MEQIAYSEHIITSGGARIVLSVWAPPAPDAAVVFIPATMVYPLYYEPLLRGFAERGFAVVGLHPVGHGKSPRIVFNTGGHMLMVTRPREVCETLAAKI